MLTPVVQRWRERRGVYRPAGELFDPRNYEVAEIPDDNTAKAFVAEHHYSGTYPAARRRYGLYRGDRLDGVAVYSVPVRSEVLRPFPVDRAAELGRFVLRDSVAANGESWFLARTFELLRAANYTGIVSFSDPVARTDAAGAKVFVGHIGTIYQATNATYTGRAKADTLYLLPDGTVFSRRALVKLRKREKGWQYAVEKLVSHGAPAPGADLAAWIPRALAAATRKIRHGGNHRYLFALDRHGRKLLPAEKPYPKFAPPVC